MKLTITNDEFLAIGNKLKDMHLPEGMGNEENACSIAAINLALNGKLTDIIPDCMSPLIGKYIINIQDRMPDTMRNSIGWKQLLPYAAGTGDEFEYERNTMIMDWVFDVAKVHQSFADDNGFGDEWSFIRKQKKLPKDFINTFEYIQCNNIGKNASIFNQLHKFIRAMDAKYAMTDRLLFALVHTDGAHTRLFKDTNNGFWHIANPCMMLKKLIEISHETNVDNRFYM